MGEIIKTLSDDRAIKALQDLNISVSNNDGTYRSLIDIIEALRECWDNLTERQRNYICDIIKENIYHEE